MKCSIGRITVSALLIAAPLSAASAADMPLKAPPPPPAPVYSWTGAYVGGNIGYSWGYTSGDLNVTTVSPFPLGLPTSFPGLTHPDGVIGGGQIGYNWQANQTWVLGLEADIQGSHERASTNITDPFNFFYAVGAAGLPATVNQTDREANIQWFGTVRGRVGVLATPTLLLYATGGLAYGRISTSDNFAVNVSGFVPPTVFSATFGNSAINVGWTVGAGLEGMFPNTTNWTWKAEYLYIDFGSISGSGGGTLPVPFGTYSFGWSTRVTDNIVRVGLDYHFGGLH